MLMSKYFLLGVGVVTALMIIMIVGAILSGNKGGEKNDCFRLYLHLTNTTKEVNTYQDYLKSSDLRASNSSLKGILTNTNNDLKEYLTAKYKFKDKDIDKDIVEEATLQYDALHSELAEAKINGILDRVYAHKMTYEISVLMAEEAKIVNSTSNDTLKNFLTTSYNSLNTLYSQFNDFSETK